MGDLVPTARWRLPPVYEQLTLLRGSPVQFLPVYLPAFTLQQHVQAAIAEPTPFRRRLLHPDTQPGVLRSLGLADRSRPTHRHVFDCTPWSSSPNPQHSSSNWVPEVFSEHLFQCGDVHHLLGQHLLQLSVLAFQRLQPPRIRDLHAALLGSPFVERRVTNPVLVTKLLRAKPSLMLSQYANDLLFAETASLHLLSPQLEKRLTSNRGLFRGAGHLDLNGHDT